VIPTRESPVSSPNDELQELAPQDGEGNVAWFKRSDLKVGVVMLGGTSLVDFRLRVAQSALRSDLTPSYWSVCGLIRDDGSFRSVPLQPADIAAVPKANAVEALWLEQFDDPAEWPNIAVLSFADNAEELEKQADRVAGTRSIVDLPPLVLAWLGHAWAVDNGANPLAAANGIPGAAFVEAAHSLAGIELTPGMSSAASCPEAIWQAVKWWHEYYAGVAQLGVATAAKPIVPVGRYALRQRSAAVRLAPDAPLFTPDQPRPT